METTRKTLEDIIGHVETFGKTTIELSKLRSLETSTRLVPLVVARVCVIAMISFFIFVLNIGIALLLGDLLGRSYIGFFIVSGFYLILGVVFRFFLHGWIKKPIGEMIIKQILR